MPQYRESSFRNTSHSERNTEGKFDLMNSQHGHGKDGRRRAERIRRLTEVTNSVRTQPRQRESWCHEVSIPVLKSNECESWQTTRYIAMVMQVVARMSCRCIVRSRSTLPTGRAPRFAYLSTARLLAVLPRKCFVSPLRLSLHGLHARLCYTLGGVGREYAVTCFITTLTGLSTTSCDHRDGGQSMMAFCDPFQS